MAEVQAFEGPRIRVRGARTHNLKDVDVDVPRDRLVVVTGPSGSGKSSLAFDTLFAEGQRRYVESLSVAARQRLAQLPKPDVDLIEGLSPAIAIAQGRTAPHPRSTVGTLTEVLDYLRLLYARVGEVYSHRTGERMVRHSVSDMADAVLALGEGTKLSILAPVVVDAVGAHADRLDALRQQGFVRVGVDGRMLDLSEPIELDGSARHTIEVYVDRIKVKPGIRPRLADSLQTAAVLAGGRVDVETTEGERMRFAEFFTDFESALVYPELTPALLSFNSPRGACPRCDGLGLAEHVDLELLVPDRHAAMPEAVVPWAGRAGRARRKVWPALAEHHGVAVDASWDELPEALKITLIEGSARGSAEPAFEGLRAQLEALSEGEDEPQGEGEPLDYRRTVACPACDGSGLRIEARMVRVAGATLPDLSAMPLHRLASFFDALDLGGEAGEIASAVLGQVQRRLAFLQEVGLSYLSLDRRANTLSSGELQRIRLAAQVGGALVGVTYILDEPSVGLHPRDNARLIAVLRRLVDLGNSVVVVEHDEDTMRAADWIIDMGPGAGVEGGTIVACGAPRFLCDVPESATGRVLAGTYTPARFEARGRARAWLELEGATGHNLRDVDLRIPVGRMSCVTGVSGSGKSSLVIDTLLPAARRELARARGEGLPYRALEGLSHFDKVVHVEQSPIGRSGRSNPATFTGLFSEIRSLFAALPESKMRGYAAKRFSFNVKGGRCESCQGEGVRRVSMEFLPDLFVACDRCEGSRYNPETLEIQWKGKSIADVLALSVAQACECFSALPSLRHKLEVLRDVGLGYVTLGQAASTLSGGEAQRIKLARELGRRSPGRSLYVLDEPTTGLHFGDVTVLLGVLQRLVDEGHTVLVIEHDLQMIAAADHVIDMGPEGGEAGGRVIATGTPQEVAATSGSHTGAALKDYLERTPGR